VNRKGESVTQSQLTILRAAACTVEEKPNETEQQEPQIICLLALFAGDETSSTAVPKL